MKTASFRTLTLFGLMVLFGGCGKKQTAAARDGFAMQITAIEAKRQPMGESLSLVSS